VILVHGEKYEMERFAEAFLREQEATLDTHISVYKPVNNYVRMRAPKHSLTLSLSLSHSLSLCLSVSLSRHTHTHTRLDRAWSCASLGIRQPR
jgi:hypothetical protein